ncbi:MAG: tRNA (guanosine(46)-N7)-methyltransferase TrmB, partial [Pseudomonadota bacterium]
MSTRSKGSPRPQRAYGPLRSFGRTGGRPLSARQQKLFDDLLPTIEAPAADAASLRPASLFAKAASEIWLEVGFGGGEHLIEQARRRPDIGFVGVEP